MYQAQRQGLGMVLAICIMLIVSLRYSIGTTGLVVGIIVLPLVCEPLIGAYIRRRARVADRPRVPKARIVRRR